jgi:ribonuclease Y
MNILSQINLFVMLVIILFLGVFFYAGYYFRKMIAEKKVKKAEELAKAILDEAKKQSEARKREIELESKDLLHKMRQDFERETRDRRQELQNLEKRMMQREENLDKKVDLLERREKEINQRDQITAQKETRLKEKEKELERLITEEKDRLEKISGLTPEEAKNILLQRMEQEVRKEASMIIKRIEEETREEADKKAKGIIGMAIQRCAAEHTVETTVSVVSLPSDDMKGRIIGREGRNIRAFEMATGVDVIIDDTPEAVTLSGFDPVRREIARISLMRLIEDGRIQAARIEEVVDKVKKEMEETIQEEGKNAALDLGIHGLHPELIKLLGRLKYRTSYGQNVLQHSKEVAYLMGVMASELREDFALARRVGLLHDIGKAVDHEVEGTHPQIGMELARKYGESEVVVQAVGAHHEDIEQRTIYAVLAQAADAVSSSRPGARRETLESYIKRLEKLESVADSFAGVEKAFAIQAGREVRVMVFPDKISDTETIALAREIKKKIEEGLEYPGQIKITVIRETRTIEYAK